MTQREELAKLLYEIIFPPSDETYSGINPPDWEDYRMKKQYLEDADRLLPYLRERVDTAVKAERERCATIKPQANVHTHQVADQPSYRKGYMDALYDLRAAIRAGEEKP